MSIFTRGNLYLGVWISDDLSWSRHIESICSKSRRSLGCIFRTFSPHCDPAAVLSLYKSQVLPVLEYACVVWDPHLKKDQLLLEAVQLFATRLSSRQWSAKSDILNQYFNLPSLLDRSKYFKLLFTYKFVFSHLYCPSGFFSLCVNRNLRVSL